MTTDGFRLYPAHLDPDRQRALLQEVMAAAGQAPFFTPTMPRTGAPFSVVMTNLGPLGWVSDRDGGYRYQSTHPVTGQAWPPMPDMLLEIWATLCGYSAPPEACLVNLYRGGAKMGLHVDADEEAADAPVLSISLGDAALFRLGGRRRTDPTRSLKLSSGDVAVLGGESRHFYHGVDRILPGTSRLIPDGGRINLTLRRVTRP